MDVMVRDLNDACGVTDKALAEELDALDADAQDVPEEPEFESDQADKRAIEEEAHDPGFDAIFEQPAEEVEAHEPPQIEIKEIEPDGEISTTPIVPLAAEPEPVVEEPAVSKKRGRRKSS